MTRRVEQLDDPDAGRLPGDVLEPLEDLPLLDELPEPSPERAREVLDALAVVKLNGGLGTSMGLSGPKSLLEVKPGASFLDVIATQVLALRERHGARLPLVVMNSASTPGAVAGGAAPLCGPARAGGAAGVPAGPRAEAARGRPAARASGRRTRTWSGARPGTATSTPRSPPPGCSTPCSTRGCAGASCRTRTTSARSPTSGWPPGSPTRRCPSPWRRCAAPRLTARAATSPAAAVDRTGARWCCARPRRCPTATRPSARSTAGATTTRTICGWTCRHCATCRPPTPAPRRCR